jgi:hypothetical protein
MLNQVQHLLAKRKRVSKTLSINSHLIPIGCNAQNYSVEAEYQESWLKVDLAK